MCLCGLPAGISNRITSATSTQILLHGGARSNCCQAGEEEKVLSNDALDMKIA